MKAARCEKAESDIAIRAVGFERRSTPNGESQKRERENSQPTCSGPD